MNDMESFNIKTLLQQVLEERMKKNSLYSMRSFARDLNIAPSTLSEVMNEKKNLSLKKIEEVLKILKIPDWQNDYLKKQKVKLDTHQIASSIIRPDYVKEATVRSLTSWLDLGILEATHLKTFKSDKKWIAKHLNVDEIDVKQSIERLINVGLLKIHENGSYEDQSPFFSTTDGIPSEAIRQFHISVLGKAQEKILKEDVSERVVKTVIFSIEEEQVEEAKNILNDAISKIMVLASKTENKKDHVMCFSSQLIYLLKGDKNV